MPKKICVCRHFIRITFKLFEYLYRYLIKKMFIFLTAPMIIRLTGLKNAKSAKLKSQMEFVIILCLDNTRMEFLLFEKLSNFPNDAFKSRLFFKIFFIYHLTFIKHSLNHLKVIHFDTLN